jgi:hypothetical protein
MVDINKPEYTDLAPRIGTVSNRSVGHLAGCVEKFSLF